MSEHAIASPVEKRLNTTDAASQGLSVSHLDDIGLYKAHTEKRPIIIRAAMNFMKSPNERTLFHTPTFYTGTKTFLREMSAVFPEHNSDASS